MFVHLSVHLAQQLERVALVLEHHCIEGRCEGVNVVLQVLVKGLVKQTTDTSKPIICIILRQLLTFCTTITDKPTTVLAYF